MGLFDEQLSRKPNNYPWTQDFIDAHWKGFWTKNEFEFKKDVNDFKTVMSEEARQVLVRDLVSIGQVEIDVKTFWARIGEIMKHPSIIDLGFVLAHTEVIHNQAYEKLLDVLNLGKAFEENLKEKPLMDRVKYLKKHLNRPYGDEKYKQFIYSLILFTMFVEEVSLFSQFYIALAFNTHQGGILPDVSQQIQYTRQEETLHANVGKSLINILRYEYPEYFDDELEQRIYKEAQDAYEAECKIIDWILRGYTMEDRHGLTVVNGDILKYFIGSRINAALADINYGGNPITLEGDYSQNVAWFYEELHGNSSTDFFVKNPIEYQKHDIKVTAEDLW